MEMNPLFPNNAKRPRYTSTSHDLPLGNLASTSSNAGSSALSRYERNQDVDRYPKFVWSEPQEGASFVNRGDLSRVNDAEMYSNNNVKCPRYKHPVYQANVLPDVGSGSSNLSTNQDQGGDSFSLQNSKNLSKVLEDLDEVIEALSQEPNLSQELISLEDLWEKHYLSNDQDKAMDEEGDDKKEHNPFSAGLNPSTGHGKRKYGSKIKQEADLLGMSRNSYRNEYLPGLKKTLKLPKGSRQVRPVVQQLLDDAQASHIPCGEDMRNYVKRNLKTNYQNQKQMLGAPSRSKHNRFLAGLNPSNRHGKQQYGPKIKQEARLLGMSPQTYIKVYLPGLKNALNLPKGEEIRPVVQQLLEEAKAAHIPPGKETHKYVDQSLL